MAKPVQSTARRPVENDPDSTFKGAHDVGAGTYSDTLTSSSDADVFRFRLEAGQSVTLDTDNGGDGIPDTEIFLSTEAASCSLPMTTTAWAVERTSVLASSSPTPGAVANSTSS